MGLGPGLWPLPCVQVMGDKNLPTLEMLDLQ